MLARTSITDRMLGALRLDVRTYEEVEVDEKATGEAAFIVVASALVAAAGYALRQGGTVNAGMLGAIGELVGWALYAWFAYLVGAKLLPGKGTRSSWGEIARTLGYATTPRFFLILVAIPGTFGLVRLLVSLWMLAATVVALRSALDCGTLRAIVVAVIASLIQGAVVGLLLGLV
ncbi:MAG TPA: YIP1 family protein [Candidatus Limnocylindrales bacterium]|nr:YIP1 family protein [Candidatus Limnocylindrales bacterium]